MAETLKGKGFVWGLPYDSATDVNSFTATDGSATLIGTTDMPQSADFSWESDKEELRDGVGEVRGACYYNARKSVTITVVPAGAASSNAVTNMALMLLKPGSKIVLTDADSADVAGNYTLESVRARRTNTSIATVEMDIMSYEEDISTTVS